MIRLIGSEITMALQCFDLGKLEFVEDGDFWAKSGIALYSKVFGFMF